MFVSDFPVGGGAWRELFWRTSSWSHLIPYLVYSLRDCFSFGVNWIRRNLEPSWGRVRPLDRKTSTLIFGTPRVPSLRVTKRSFLNRWHMSKRWVRTGLEGEDRKSVWQKLSLTASLLTRRLDVEVPFDDERSIQPQRKSRNKSPRKKNWGPGFGLTRLKGWLLLFVSTTQCHYKTPKFFYIQCFINIVFETTLLTNPKKHTTNVKVYRVLHRT